MTFCALPIALALVVSTFPVQSATTLMVRHYEKLGDVKDMGQGHGLRDGDRNSHYASRNRDTHLMFLQGAKPEEDDESDEESEEDDKDITGKNKVADDKEDEETKEGKQARNKDSDEKSKEGKKDNKNKHSKDAVKKDKQNADEKDKDDADDEEEDDEDDDKVEELKKQLSVSLIQKREYEAELKSFEDDGAFAKKLAVDVESVGNETQSYALARFLGSLKASQRQFAKKHYTKYLNKEVEKMGKKIKKLKKALEKAEDDIDDKAKKETQDKKKGAKAQKEAEKDMDLPTHATAGQTFAIAFFSNVALLAVVFAMANADNKSVMNYTRCLIDNVVAIFLAVMHFQAFDSLLSFSALGVSSAVISSIVHTLFLLFVVLVAAYYLRKKKVALAVLCGAGAHFVSFSSIHASASMQNSVFVSYSETTIMCVFGLCVLGLGLAMVCFLAHTAKKRAEVENDPSYDGYLDKTDDLENDVCATAFSVVFTMLIRFVLTGHHPVDDDTDFDHSAGERMRMLIYAFVCLVLAGFGIVFISRKAAGAPYATKRMCDFFSTVLAMNVAWAFLYWGEWEFFETLYPNDPVQGRVMFAIVVTLLGGLLLIIFAGVPRVDARVDKLVLTALGLVIAFSWELTFDSAIEQMVEGDSHPVVMKIMSCLAMLAIIVPVYAFYMKPFTMKSQEALEGDAPPPKVEVKVEKQGEVAEHA
mmetsp:Transcript_29662/g.47775  ORF Transcript_29662/g.47775 Transcript_29662/m.47775 type:complete len:701 (+) Transcript_29662:46-2148(+)